MYGAQVEAVLVCAVAVMAFLETQEHFLVSVFA
jgi:hypothetical protein